MRDPYRKVSVCVATIMLLSVVCLSAQVVALIDTDAPCTEPVIAPALSSPRETSDEVSAPVRDTSYIIDSFVEAIVQIESAGDADEVGKAGERGLMQIKRATWNSVTAKLFGQSVPFERAFDPGLNRQVGRAYLLELKRFLRRHRDAWRADERALLLACYNAGPTRVMHAGFRVEALPLHTRSYIERACALHDDYVSEHEAAATLTAQIASVAEDAEIL